MEVTYPSEIQVAFNGQHGVISQKKELFLTAALRTSDLV
jgi:hypothetical protein